MKVINVHFITNFSKTLMEKSKECVTLYTVGEHSVTWKLFSYQQTEGAYQFNDVLVSALHDYDKFIYFDLQELWFVSGKSDSRTVFIFHNFFCKMEYCPLYMHSICYTVQPVILRWKK